MVETTIPGNTDGWWESCALAAIETLAKSGRVFTAADLADLGVDTPDHPCRWGSVFAKAKAAGTIVRVGYAPSRTAGRRGGVCAMWFGANA